eukprot:1154497-Pelagomonas_calceolata.AAC.3
MGSRWHGGQGVANQNKLSGQFHVLNWILKLGRHLVDMQASCGLSMRVDGEFKEEWIATHFVWIGALAGGFGGG